MSTISATLHVAAFLLAVAAGPVIVWGTALSAATEKVEIEVDDGG
jgi:hypothetical protein